MSAIEESVDIHADTQRLYEMLTEFEQYPHIIPGLTEVRKTGETLMHWVSDMEGHRHEWDAQVVEMDPEKIIAFQSLHQDPPVRCTIMFQPVGEGTRITLRVENDPGEEPEVRTYLARSLSRLKEIAEQGPPTRWPTEPMGIA